MVKQEKDIAILDSNQQEIVIGDKKQSPIIPYTKKDIEVVKKTNCKLCMSEFREEAEVMFDKTNNYSAVVRWIEEKGEKMTIPAVRNHIIYHYKAPQKKEFLIEYTKDISKWVMTRSDKIDAIKNRMAILDRELLMIGCEGDDLPLEQRRKNAEIMKKLADTLLVYESKLTEYEKQLEPVTVIVQELRIIIKDEMEQGVNNETRRVLINILEKLQQSIGAIKNIGEKN